MKKTYIKPNVIVMFMTEGEAMLAGSDTTTSTGGYDGSGNGDGMDEDNAKFHSVWDSEW